MSVLEIARKAKAAAVELRASSVTARLQALTALSALIRDKGSEIIAANAIDLDAAEKAGLDAALCDRLKLDSRRIQALADSVLAVRDQPEVLGEIVSSEIRADGLKIEKQRVPLGVILMIFESRPNVVIDAAALAIKSGNAIILKGGKEAKHSNQILGQIISEAISRSIPADCVQVADFERAALPEILKLNELIDLVIPRGGEGLVRFVYENSRIPVIAHYKGLCHVFIDASAEPLSARNIVINAKLQRPGVCNAMETLLIHKDFPAEQTHRILSELITAGTEIFSDSEGQRSFSDLPLKLATPENYQTEYLSKKMSLAFVADVAEAVDHISKYGSHHSECIVSEDLKTIEFFKNNVDAACVMINASTRFNDGAELGLGAELGISTGKLHVYGPMGAREMTTLRYVLSGTGQIRK